MTHTLGGGELAEDEAHPQNSKDSDTVDIYSISARLACDRQLPRCAHSYYTRSTYDTLPRCAHSYYTRSTYDTLPRCAHSY